MTVNVHVTVFPAKSVAVAVTGVSPKLNIVPDCCEYVTVTLPVLSFAVASGYETVADDPNTATFSTWLGGQLIVGLIVSKSNAIGTIKHKWACVSQNGRKHL